MNTYKLRVQKKENDPGLLTTQVSSGNNAVLIQEYISIGLYPDMVIDIHRLYMGMDQQRH